MAENVVPAEIEQFIAKYISSVEQLEVLLLLWNAPEKQWSVAGVHQVIQSRLSSVALRLDELSEEGFLARIESPGTLYRYAPKTAGLNASVQSLAKAYKERRIRVIELIFSKPTDPAKSFADAFKFKKGKDHG